MPATTHPRGLRGLTLALLLLLACGLPGAAVAQDGVPDGLTAWRSRHYRVLTDLPRAEAVVYGRHMDRIHRSYERLLSRLGGEAEGLQDLYLLRDRPGYLRLLAGFGVDGSASGGMFFYGGPGVRGGARGGFSGGAGVATWVRGRPREEVLATLQHEGFHQFAYLKAGDRFPIWLNEGLAEYFGDAVIVDGGVRHGVVDADRLGRLRAARADGTAMRLGDLLLLDAERWRQNLTSGSALGPLQYDQAWAAVHFLLHQSPEVERAFSDYVVSLAAGVRQEEAFRSAFGDDLAAMGAAWGRFLGRLEPDRFGEALSDLRFLAEGVGFLFERDGAVPTDAEALEAALRAARFRVTTRSHGVEREASALDPRLFRYTGEGGRERRFALVPSAEPGLPPGVAAPALRPPARIAWRRDAAGALVSELVFD